MEKKISTTYSECVLVDLGIQHEMRMSHILICCLPGCKIFSTLSHKWQDFLKKKLLYMKCLFSFPYNLYLKHSPF